MMRLVALMLIFIGISAASAQSCSYATPSSDGREVGTLILDGASEVMMPSIGLNATTGIWTYPYDCYPVYARNQTISGTYLGPPRLAGSEVGFSVIRLNTSSFQEAIAELHNFLVSDKAQTAGASSFPINNTGIGHFAAPGQASGLYVLVVIDKDKSSVLSAIPLLVNDDDISIESPDELRAGDILPVKIKSLRGKENLSRRYGAAFVSQSTYRSARIDMSSNGSRGGMTSLISIGNESLNIIGEPKISLKLVEEVLPILPQDCAVSLSESNNTEEEMYLLTDSSWKPGSYLLTCGIYSNNGLEGIRQKAIELI